MRFPPLLLSSHTSSWGGAACRERRATKVDPAPVPDIPCRFCGALAAGRQEWFHLNGDEADAAPGNLAVACTLCHLTQHLDTAAAEGSATLIWLPEMSQQALFAVARAAQLSLLEAGDDPTLDILPRRESPATIAAWRRTDRRAIDLGPRTRLLAAGYDMDNMKARGFVESEMPLPGASDPEAQDALAQALVRSADLVAGLLRNAVRQALFSPGATVKLDAELLASQRERLWERTEAAFFAALLRQGEEPEEGAKTAWLRLLREVALSLFDEAAPLRPETSMASAAPRIAAARRRLLFALTGFGKDGVALFGTLGLPLPAAQKKRNAA